MRFSSGLSNQRRRLRDIATHLSLYEIKSARIRHNIEALLLRVLVNQTHNQNIGKFRSAATQKGRGKAAIPAPASATGKAVTTSTGKVMRLSRVTVTDAMLTRPKGTSKAELVAEYDRVFGPGKGKAATAQSALSSVPRKLGYTIQHRDDKKRGRVYWRV